MEGNTGGNTKPKLLFCCIFVVILLVLKITVFEANSPFSMGSLILHLQDASNVTYQIAGFNLNFTIIFESQNASRQSTVEINTTGVSDPTRKPLKGFPYDEECFFKSYPSFSPPKDKQDFAILNTKKGKKYKTILAYHYAYGYNYGFGFGHKPFEAACCKETRCFMTEKRDKIPLDEFDAVIIHFFRFHHHYLPQKRKKHQRWIFYEKEPPTISSRNPEMYEGVFNWTMTYRKDSDIILGYGQVYPAALFPNKVFSKLLQNISSSESILQNKTKMVAWMASHCKVQSRRDEYVKSLKKYIKVDIYGKCGTMKCDRKNMLKCYEMIEKNYKFYLSFENSFCTDYMTEKFFNILRYNIIPVVRGWGNYASIAPRHSYIDVKDFNSMKELAEYLKYLASNDSAYLEYFKWKQDYFTIPMNWLNQGGSFCDLCYKLHNDPKEKIYYDLRSWFQGKSKCVWK